MPNTAKQCKTLVTRWLITKNIYILTFHHCKGIINLAVLLLTRIPLPRCSSFFWSFCNLQWRRKKILHKPLSIGFRVCVRGWRVTKWHLYIYKTIKECLCYLSAGFRHFLHDIMLISQGCSLLWRALCALHCIPVCVIFLPQKWTRCAKAAQLKGCAKSGQLNIPNKWQC